MIRLICSCLSLIVLAGILAASPAPALEVPLTVSNRGPADRTELAAGGIPLPLSALKDTKTLRVLNAEGKCVPAQFTVLNRWPSDKSLRWVLVQFPATIETGKSASFTLKTDVSIAAPKPEYALKISEDKERITVDTGVMRFSVKKAGFALFDTVELIDGGKTIPLAGPGACGSGAVLSTSSGQTVSMAAAKNTEVKLEDAGPLRTTILATGRHAGKDGKELFDFRLRIYAVAGSRNVRVQYVFTRSQGKWPMEHTALKQISLTFKPLNPDVAKSRILNPDGEKNGTILRTKSFTADENQQKRFLTGAAGITLPSTTASSVSASVRWFWQSRPKSLEVTPEGLLVINLIDARNEKEPINFYPGMAKTHDLLFRFDGAGKSMDSVASVAGFQHPLFVKCPAEWYSQKTLSLGRLVSADYKGYLPELQSTRKIIDDGFQKQIRVIRKNRSRVFDNPRGMDSYHVIHFGDGFHHKKKSGHTGIEWDNCYYSYTHLLAMQYARTADDLFLDTLMEATTFESDISFIWHQSRLGAPRVNPGAYHIGAFSGWGKRFSSGTYNFYKPIGMLECFYLTGDRHMQEAGLHNLNWMLKHNGYGMLNNPRNCGAGCRAAVHGYLATGNIDFLHVARIFSMYAITMHKTFGHFASVPNSIFMAPNALEGLCVYQEFTGDPELGAYIDAMVNNHFQRFCKKPASLVYGYMMFFSAYYSGNKSIQKTMIDGMSALRGFGVRKGNHAIKDFSANRRSVPLLMWYFSDLAAKPTPWAGKIDLGPLPQRQADCPVVKTPTIDGKVSAGEWQNATEIKLIHDPNPRDKLLAPTTLRVGHDAKNLYVLVMAEEPLMPKLKTSITEENGPVFRDDCVEIHISPVPRRLGIKLIINAAGVRAIRSRGFERKKYKAPATDNYPVKAGRWEKGWLLEVAFPFDKLPLKKTPQAGDKLGFNCNRFRCPDNGENSTWFGTSNQIDSIGTLIIK
jgi:PcRGLX-like protein central beta sandwich domain/Carbohydrate family 9 binding domain-like